MGGFRKPASAAHPPASIAINDSTHFPILVGASWRPERGPVVLGHAAGKGEGGTGREVSTKNGRGVEIGKLLRKPLWRQ